VVSSSAAHVVRGVRGRPLVEGHRADAAAVRLGRSAPAALDRGRARVERRAARAEASTRAHFRIHGRSLEQVAARLGPAATAALRRAGADLTSAQSQLSALDPARALERGWSITRTAAGSVVRRSDDVAPGDTIVTTLAIGTVTSTVADPSNLADGAATDGAPGEDEPDA
jgi:exodeoxyribonuclease VII large subunit